LHPELETLNRPAEKSRFIPLLMLALLAWGAMLALGTFLYRINQAGEAVQAGNLPMYRGLIVLACTLGFLGLWLAALASRRKRETRKQAAKAE
jgi:hypothetical protein